MKNKKLEKFITDKLELNGEETVNVVLTALKTNKDQLVLQNIEDLVEWVHDLISDLTCGQAWARLVITKK